MYSKNFLKLLVFVMILYTSNCILEVSINNFRALSLYYWLGFSIVNIRCYYYILSSFSISAYSLINTKSISFNIIRRYIVLDLF
uniref:Orf149 n=1 Tax=Gracilaria firma TaxID=2510791 RepID=A0A2Z2JIR5_9FLOR|nr:orf149 [Gracilaria changii]ART65297.1 orf149 [Gracilaria changii]